MVTKTCSWCKKEDKAFLVFFKPKGWIKHKTRDKMDMLFCSLVCFQAFTGVKLRPKSRESKKPIKVHEEEQLAAVPA